VRNEKNSLLGKNVPDLAKKPDKAIFKGHATRLSKGDGGPTITPTKERGKEGEEKSKVPRGNDRDG